MQLMIQVFLVSGLSGSVIDNRNALIRSQIEAHAPNKDSYSLIAKIVNVGVALLVYGRDEGVARRTCDVETAWTGCGPAYMGNKGAVGVRFRVSGPEGTSGETYTYISPIKNRNCSESLMLLWQICELSFDAIRP